MLMVVFVLMKSSDNEITCNDLICLVFNREICCSRKWIISRKVAHSINEVLYSILMKGFVKLAVLKGGRAGH